MSTSVADLSKYGIVMELYPMTLVHNTQQKLKTGPISPTSSGAIVGCMVVAGNLGSVTVATQAYDIDSDGAPRITVTFSSSATRDCTVALFRKMF